MTKKNCSFLLLIATFLCSSSIASAAGYIDQQPSGVYKNNFALKPTSTDLTPTKVDPANITFNTPNQSVQSPPPLTASSVPTYTQSNVKPSTTTNPNPNPSQSTQKPLQNNIPATPVQNTHLNNNISTARADSSTDVNKIHKNAKEVEQKNEEEAKLYDKKHRSKQADVINNLYSLDYNTQSPPKALYERKQSPFNVHLPPVYFKSYYLYLAFKSAEKDDINGLNAVLSKYNFLNGQNIDGDTVLMHAIQNNSLNAARLLLAKGAYVDAVNNRKRTALHYAATLGNLNLIKLLLSMGSNYSLTDDNNMTAIDYAYASNQNKAAEMIEKYIRQNKLQ